LQSQTEIKPNSSEQKPAVAEKPKKSRREVVEEFIKLPGGASILECIQCGVCSGSCPTRASMDYSPTQIIKMITLGMRDEVLSSHTIWVCSSCHTCMTRCPRGVDFTTLMMSLRNLAIKENVAQSKIKPKFHKGYTDVVGKYGRLHEPSLLLKIMDKKDPKGLLHNASLGIRLVKKGKISLKPQKIKATEDLAELYEKTKGGKQK
jgi:heterodisulfide reductase subunit C